MPRVAKISISLPLALLKRVDRYCRITGETRSEFLRRAAIASLEAEEHREAVRRYLDSYAAEPESPHELDAIGRAGRDAIVTESWE